MEILEFAEKIYPNQLTDIQKQILKEYELAKNSNLELIVCTPRFNGKTMILNVIKKLKESENSND